MNKKAQQEMVGFVLIVTIVVIALIVFLVMSLNKGDKEVPQSEMANNLLGSILGTTTNCSLNYDGNNQTIEDILANIYSSGYSRCVSGESIRGSLNSSLDIILNILLRFDDVINYYDFTVYYSEDEVYNLEYEYIVGNCSGSVYSSEPIIFLSSGETYYTSNLRICIDD